MTYRSKLCLAIWATILSTTLPTLAQTPPTVNAPLPDIRQLMREVQAHQRELDKMRESYTFTSMHAIQDIDANGQVKKTRTDEHEDCFVNGHLIERTVKRDGIPLSDKTSRKKPNA
jgi:hypothetical protein